MPNTISPPSKEMTRKFRGIPLTQFMKNAAIKDPLADTAGTSLLGLADANGSPLLGSSTNNTSVTEAAVVYVPVPSDYVPGSKLYVAVRAKVSVARTVAATVDLTVKALGDSLGSDINATDAQALTTAYKTFLFDITPTGLIPGRTILEIVLTLLNNDTGGSTGGAASATEVYLEYEGRY